MRRAIYLFVASVAAWGQIITTAAGNSTWGNPYDVVVDSAGNIYCSAGSVVYKVNRLGETTVVAGRLDARGDSGDGGPATQALFRSPTGIALAEDGTLYIADSETHRIRRVSPQGIVTTFAGTGGRGFSGDGGPANQALLYSPADLVLDRAGNLIVADFDNRRIRRIAPNGTITTIAGTGRAAFGGDGGPPLLADIRPRWLALGPDGSLYFSDGPGGRYSGESRVRRIRANIVEAVAGNGVSASSGDGGAALQASIVYATGIAVDGAGNLYIAEAGAYSNLVRRVTPEGIITTYAGTGRGGYSGDGGPARSAEIEFPAGLFVDGEGTLFIADYDNRRVRKVTAPRPSISSTNSAVPSFFGKSGFGSNMYVEIYGTNLAATTRSWRGSDFSGSRAPTSLDGVSVSVNGKPAYVYYVSPTQININTPEDTATGAVNIQVTNSLGVSNLGSAMRTRVSPALQSVPSFTSQGRSHVVAQTPDFRSFIGRPGMVQGVNFTLAKPGDSIILYALGCGPTNPATEAGVAAGANARLSLPFELKIGGVPAPVAFAGIVAGSIGLYQINATIPSVNGGDQPIELVVDGVSNNQNLYLAIEGQAVTTGVEPPAGYTFTRIAHNAGTPMLRDVQTDFSISESGTVVFTGIRVDGGIGVYAGSGTDLRLIADLAASGYANMAVGGINRQNTAVLVGRRSDGNIEIMTAATGGGLTRIASGPSIPLSLDRLPDINDSGDVAYFDGTRVMLFSNGASRVIADTSAAGVVSGAALRGLQINQRGDVTFSAANRTDVYLFQNGSISVLATRSANFQPTLVSPPSVNNRAQVAFSALAVDISTPNAFYTAAAGVAPQPLWRSETSQFLGSLALNRISLNDNGLPAFVALESSGAALYTGAVMAKNRVIGTADSLFGTKVGAVYAGAAGGGKVINNRGQIAFFYIYDDLSFGIAVATPQ